MSTIFLRTVALPREMVYTERKRQVKGMQSEIRHYTYPDGEIQRVQIVRPGSWDALEFWKLAYEEPALDCFADIYRLYLVPACPWLFGNMVLFRLPEDVQTKFPMETKYGHLADRLTAAAAALRSGVKICRGKPVFSDEKLRAFWEELEARRCIRVVSGRLPITTIIPVGPLAGYLSKNRADAALKANASFFIMDRFDCATVFDHIGTPLGLQVKDGRVLNPPLYDREALLVKKDGTVTVEPVSVKRLEIAGQTWCVGEDATLHTRPRRARVVGNGKKLVIVGCHVAAVCEGKADIPASGFALCPEGACAAKPGDRVIYRGLEDVAFGIQVGNSILRNGEKTLFFRSKFYNIRHLEPVPYPPSLYPMDFRGARAARMALGADEAGKPVLLWAEGAAKLGHRPGADSRGATLADMADFCADAGMVNAVNLDGGGSAQLLLGNKRSLLISDRKGTDMTEAERPVPLALSIE